jgi:hypothetical protein
LEIKENKNIKITDYSTFLYSNCTNESIDDYLFLLLYHCDFDSKEYKLFIEKEVMQNKNLSNCYHTDKGELYIFNFFDRRKTVDMFMKGCYSKFPESDKSIILKYYKTPDTKTAYGLTPNNIPQAPHHVILYPEYYYEYVAKELYAEKDFYSGMEYLKRYSYGCGELWGKYSMEKEHLDCVITDNCVTNYDKLTLNFIGT